MPRFHFHLRALGMINRDLEGTELPDLTAARSHAAVVTGELMRNSGVGTRHWSMWVENESGEPEFDLFFADVDPSLADYSPQMRMLVGETCRRLGALTDVMCAARATQVEARMLLARARGKPQLVYASGE
jgi:hypothetical protein